VCRTEVEPETFSSGSRNHSDTSKTQSLSSLCKSRTYDNRELQTTGQYTREIAPKPDVQRQPDASAGTLPRSVHKHPGRHERRLSAVSSFSGPNSPISPNRSENSGNPVASLWDYFLSGR